MNSLNKTCEFCLEFQDFAKSRVGRIYKDQISNRIVAQSDNFLVIPTIGQIIPGSLLVLPKSHFETFAEVPHNLVSEAIDLSSSVTLGKRYLLWEHGARNITNASCGVYHAHLHLIPMEIEVEAKELLGEDGCNCTSIEEAFLQLKNADNYILFQLSGEKPYYSVFSPQNPERFKSQYFRRWLVSRFAISKDWDWKNYEFIEPELLNVVQ